MSGPLRRIGVIGGGQLGQMLALAGHPLGLTVDCFETSAQAPASRGGHITVGHFDNADALHRWAQQMDVITFEFESFPVEMAADLAEIALVRPGVAALAAAQDRHQEKKLFSELDIPVAPFRLCSNLDQVKRALVELGPTVIAKTRTGGYDGKGQAVLDEQDEDVSAAAPLLEHGDIVVEQKLDFDFEFSIVAARCANGTTVAYPPARNQHREGILRVSKPDDPLDDTQRREATAFTERLLEHLDYVGVLALEMFMVGGRLVANEMAPRVHNSGHWSIEGAETSQFENHLRAIADLPLGSTGRVTPSAMVNLIGDHGQLPGMLSVPGAHLHDYGKEARPGRKLGHVTVTAPTWDELDRRLALLDESLQSST